MSRASVLSILAMPVIFGGLIWMAFESERQWQSYAAEHHCREVSRVWRGLQLQMMPAGNGQMIPQMVDQGDEVTYNCDNGEVLKR
jgi:hypothetical protein